MSLKIWLPLKGDLHNQGSSKTYSTQTTGYTVESNGKLGSCIKFSSVFDTQIPIEDWDYVNKSISLCCWAKISKTELAALVNTYSYDSTYSTAGGTLIGRNAYGGFSIRWKTNNIYNDDGQLNKLYVYAHIRNTNTSNNTIVTSNYEVPFDTWFHVAAILDRENSKLYFYVNGTLVNSKDFTITGTFNTGTFLIAQASWDGGNGRASSGAWMLNDVRVYDHCLSTLEIKEIAQGLVLHYPLDNKGWGQENLLLNTLKDSKKSHPEYGFITFNFSESLIAGETYTISAKINTSEKTFIGFYHSGGSYTMSGWMPITSNGIYKKTFTANSNMASQTGGSGHGFCKVYASNNPAGTQSSYPIAGTANVEWIKIEKGSKATGWSPNPNDDLATTLGVNSGNIIDCSGYGNNAISNGSVPIEIISDFSKYGCYTNFKSGARIATPVSASTFLPTDVITVSCWFKSSNATARFLSCTESGGFNFESASGKVSFPIYINGKGYTRVNGTTDWTTLSNNEWHMLTATYDRQYTRLYIDGVLDTETVSSYPDIDIKYGANTPFTLGAEAQTIASPIAGTYAGGLSDVRVYATALSAEDIKALYETSMSIDNLGQIHGFKFDEFNGSQIQSIGKNGIINCKELIEDDGAHFYEDGSIEANNFIEK